MVMQREISDYVRRVGENCPFSVRMKLKKKLKNSLSDFLDEKSDCTMDDVVEHFGSPEKFTDEYVLAMDAADRQNILHKVKWFKRTIGIGIAVVVLIVVTAAIWVVCENSRMVGYYYTEEVIKLDENRQN